MLPTLFQLGPYAVGTHDFFVMLGVVAATIVFCYEAPRRAMWIAPTKMHTPDTPGNFDPLPGAYLRGLGEMQTQHTCILLEDEIGDVIQLALATPFVGGISIQPQFGSGRSTPIDPLNRLTHTGVLARIEPQTGGRFSWRDLTALPCSHPHCCSIGYLIQTDSGEWRSLVAMIGHERLAAFVAGLVFSVLTLLRVII